MYLVAQQRQALQMLVMDEGFLYYTGNEALVPPQHSPIREQKKKLELYLVATVKSVVMYRGFRYKNLAFKLRSP